MRREKRAAPVRSYTTHTLRQQLDLFRAEGGRVVSMSDYLHRVIEEHVALKIVKQSLGKRVGNQ